MGFGRFSQRPRQGSSTPSVRPRRRPQGRPPPTATEVGPVPLQAKNRQRQDYDRSRHTVQCLWVKDNEITRVRRAASRPGQNGGSLGPGLWFPDVGRLRRRPAKQATKIQRVTACLRYVNIEIRTSRKGSVSGNMNAKSAKAEETKSPLCEPSGFCWAPGPICIGGDQRKRVFVLGSIEVP